eukprot:scaffold1275_cov401-Prasinococcus_capsulatus_cf.AAC.1
MAAGREKAAGSSGTGLVAKVEEATEGVEETALGEDSGTLPDKLPGTCPGKPRHTPATGHRKHPSSMVQRAGPRTSPNQSTQGGTRIQSPGTRFPLRSDR